MSLWQKPDACVRVCAAVMTWRASRHRDSSAISVTCSIVTKLKTVRRKRWTTTHLLRHVITATDTSNELSVISARVSRKVLLLIYSVVSVHVLHSAPRLA